MNEDMINKIYNEDCLNVMKKIPNETVNLIVTDPPYLVSYKTGHRKNKEHRFNKVILNDNNEELIKEYIAECHRILKQNSAMYMFCSASKVDFFKSELEKHFNIKNMIVWQKNNHTAGDLKNAFGRKYELIFLVNKGQKQFNGERLTDVWSFDRVPHEHLIHQNQKPLPLIEQCIEKHSCENDLIFDGFMGSGTTAIAAMNTNRRFLGCELDKGYFDVAQKRIANTIPFKQINLFDV